MNLLNVLMNSLMSGSAQPSGGGLLSSLLGGSSGGGGILGSLLGSPQPETNQSVNGTQLIQSLLSLM